MPRVLPQTSSSRVLKGQRPQVSLCSHSLPFVSSHSGRTRGPAMLQLEPPFGIEDRIGLLKGSTPILLRHVTIGPPPSANILDLEVLTPSSPGTTLLRRRTLNFPLPDRNTSIEEVLPDDVLLIIFGFYRASSPLHWHRLAHVCQRWRYIVFASPRGLDLRLYCKPGTPVLKALDCWPELPIVVQHRECQVFDSPTPEDEDNIVAALKHSDRICSISLLVTLSLLKKLGTIVQSFPELEDLVLLCRSNVYMPFPPNFRWGTRLRSLNLTGISLSALSQLFSSCPNLVDLQLHDVVGARKLPPQRLARVVSGMTRLQSLSLYFHDYTLIDIPPFSGERVVLPALTHIKIRGIKDDYLNSLVAQIDVPHLVDIEIMLVYQPNIDVSPFRQFVDRIEMKKSHRRADILTSGCAISMSLSRPKASSRLELGVYCPQLDQQLSSMARICNDFSQSLLSVRDLRIETTQSSSGRDGTNGDEWSELIRWFRGVGRFHVAGELTADILRALQPRVGELTNGALPALTNLYVIRPRSGALQDVIRSITTSRKLSHSPIVVQESIAEDGSMRILPKRTCRYCNVRLAERQDLIRHSNRRTPPEECEILCRFCHAPWQLCSASRGRLHERIRPPNVRPPDIYPFLTPLNPRRRTDTPLHISDSWSKWRPAEPQRDYRRFVPNLRSLGTLFNSRRQRRAEATASSNNQLERLDDWSTIENEALE